MTVAVNRVELAPGLYFLATPIGSARDITLRTLDILSSAEVLCAEDTRSLRKLMDIHGIKLEGRRIISYHDHSSDRDRLQIISALEDERSVAYVSEAGTPMIADPGFQLGRMALEAGHMVTSAPGPSAVLAALTNSGLPTDRFYFAGFAPSAASARRKFLGSLDAVQATLVLYESPKRIHRMLEDCVQVFGVDRSAVLARELTKKFEEVLRGTLGELVDTLADRALKGEIVVLLDRAEKSDASEEAILSALQTALTTMSRKDAVQTVSDDLAVPRRKVYQLALDLPK